MHKKRVIGDKPEWVFFITAFSMNILHAGDKLPVQRVFFKK